MLQPIKNARTLSGPGFQDLNARFQDLDLRTWVSGPQREVSGPDSQDLDFRPSVFGSQDQGFRTSKALHPTVVLSFSRHFSLRPPSLFFFPSLFSASTVTFLCVQWSPCKNIIFKNNPLKETKSLQDWQTVMADDEEEESERRTGLCILIHRQNRFCHRKCRLVLPVN